VLFAVPAESGSLTPNPAAPVVLQQPAAAPGSSPAIAVATVVPPPAARRDTPQTGLSLPRLGCVALASLFFLALGSGLTLYCLLATTKSAGASTTDRDAGTEASAAAAKRRAAAENRLINLPKDEQVKVNQAIEKAVRYLKISQMNDGTWSGGEHGVGYAAFPGLTLLECDVPGSDPTVSKAATYVRANCEQLRDTYDIALAILFLDQLNDYAGKSNAPRWWSPDFQAVLGDYSDQKLIQILAVRLATGQKPDGGFTYTCPVLSAKDHRDVTEVLKKGLSDPAFDVRNVHRAVDSRAYDNSNTQFAVLGLWVARRKEAPVDKTIALVVKHFRNQQHADDGGWDYDPGRRNVAQSGRPTMACAGLLGLAIGHGLGREVEGGGVAPQKDPKIQHALRLLGQEITPQDENHRFDLYFLWSTERVAVLYDLKNIDGRDWYAWGSKMILHRQADNGSWPVSAHYGSSAAINTCFATLFLKQANLAKDLSSKLQLLGK